MLNPQLLTTFSTIVSAGSISAAAVRLGCGKSVVSRQLARLEADLGTRLIQRTTRKLTLTEVGKVVLLEAQQISRALNNVAQISGQFQQEVRGTLRIACPRPLGQRHLVPLITEFTRLPPPLTWRRQEHPARPKTWPSTTACCGRATTACTTNGRWAWTATLPWFACRVASTSTMAWPWLQPPARARASR